MEDTTTKANKTLGFVRRNISECTSQVKYVAYTTMVRPRLEYSSKVWDPQLTSDVHTLEQVQRRAVRFVHGNYTRRTPGYVTNMVHSLWVRVPPATTLHGQAINALQDPA